MAYKNYQRSYPLPRTRLRSPIALLAFGFSVLLSIVAMTYFLAERSRVNFDSAISTRDQRTAAVELRNAVLAAESSQRGFIFSGNEVYLAPFDTAVAQALRWLDALENTVDIYPDSARLVDRLRTLTTEMLADMQTLIQLKRDRRNAEVLALFRTNRGKAMMDEANVFFSGLIFAADDRLTRGVTEQRANAAWLRTVTIIGGVLIVIVVGFAAASILSQTRNLATAQADLAAFNADLEAKVVARTTDLSLANAEIQRFAYVVTHDLRAPLVNIMGFTSELEAGVGELVAALSCLQHPDGPSDALLKAAETAATEDIPEAIHFIRSSTRKMDDLIKAILSLARDGQRSIRPEALDLRSVIAASAAGVRHQVLDAGGSLTEIVLVQSVVTDRIAFDQILGNLLDNAVKYRRKDRPLEIIVRAEREGDYLSLSVKDNGRGIDARDLERIFDPFRRAGTQDQPGEGIGLTSAYGAARRLSATILVESVLDAGTTFTLKLPMTHPVAEGPIA